MGASQQQHAPLDAQQAFCRSPSRVLHSAITCFTASMSQAPLKPPPATVALSVHAGALAPAWALQALRLRGLALNTKRTPGAAAAQCMMRLAKKLSPLRSR